MKNIICKLSVTILIFVSVLSGCGKGKNGGGVMSPIDSVTSLKSIKYKNSSIDIINGEYELYLDNIANFSTLNISDFKAETASSEALLSAFSLAVTGKAYIKTIKTTVTAKDGTKKEYTVNVHAPLMSISVPDGRNYTMSAKPRNDSDFSVINYLSGAPLTEKAAITLYHVDNTSDKSVIDINTGKDNLGGGGIVDVCYITVSVNGSLYKIKHIYN